MTLPTGKAGGLKEQTAVENQLSAAVFRALPMRRLAAAASPCIAGRVVGSLARLPQERRGRRSGGERWREGGDAFGRLSQDLLSLPPVAADSSHLVACAVSQWRRGAPRLAPSPAHQPPMERFRDAS